MAWWDFVTKMGSGGGGGGGQGGMGVEGIGSMLGAAGKANDAIVESTTRPYRMRRARILALAPEALDIGSAIQPVSRYPGGSQMARATAAERGRAQGMYGLERGSALDRKLRNVQAQGEVAHHSAAILRKIAEMVAGGYMGATSAMNAGSAGMGGTVGMYGVEGASVGVPTAGSGAMPLSTWGTIGAGLRGAGREYLSGLGGGDERRRTPYY